MLNVSDKFLEQSKAVARTWDIIAEIDGVDFTPEHIQTFKLDKSLSNNGIAGIGGAISTKLTIKFIKSDELNNIEGKAINLKAGLLIDDTDYEWIKLGKFYIKQDSITKDEHTITIECFDKMYDLTDVTYNSSLTYPISVQSMLSEIELNYGLNVSDKPDFSGVIWKTKPVDTSIRTMLSEFAELNGANVKIDRNNNVKFQKIRSTAEARPVLTWNYNSQYENTSSAVFVTEISQEVLNRFRIDDILTQDNDILLTSKVDNGYKTLVLNGSTYLYIRLSKSLMGNWHNSNSDSVKVKHFRTWFRANVEYIYKTKDSYELDGDNYFDFTMLSDTLIDITSVTCEYTSGNNDGYNISFDNQNIRTQADLDAIANKYSLPLSYRPYTLTSQGFPHIELGDNLILTDIKDCVRKLYVISHTLEYNGGFKSTFTANAPDENNENKVGSAGVNAVSSGMKKIRSEIIRTNEEITDRITSVESSVKAVEDIVGGLSNIYTILLSRTIFPIPTSLTLQPIEDSTFTIDISVFDSIHEVNDFTITTPAYSSAGTYYKGVQLVEIDSANKRIKFRTNSSNKLAQTSVEIPIEIKVDTLTFERTISFLAVPQGADGQDAKSIDIEGGQIFTYENNFTSLPTPNRIVLETSKQGTTSTSYEWFYKVPNGIYTKIPNETGSSLNVLPDASYWGSHRQITFKVELDGVSDEITVAKISSGAQGSAGKDGTDGVDGKDGKDGESAKYIVVEGEQVFYYSNNFASASTPSSIQLKATNFGTTSNKYQWYYKLAGSNDVYSAISGATTNTLNVGSTASYWGDNKQLTFRCSLTDVPNVADEVTIVKVSSGAVGNTGSAGLGVKSIVEEYYLSTSNTSQVGGSWVTSPPAWVNGRYFWTRSKITYTDNSEVTTNPVCVSGAQGSQGVQGTSITGVDVFYYLSTSSTSLVGGSWQTSPPAWVDGRYYWEKTITYFSNSTSTESNPVCITGAKGNQGNTGATGLGVKSIVEEYYLSTSNTSQSGGSWVTSPPAWVNGRYFWTRSKITYTDNSEVTTNPVCVSGAQGSQGNNGISITSVDVFYYLSTSNTSLAGGSWVTLPPAWADGRYYWEKTKTVFSDGTSTESNPVCITGAKGNNGTNGTNGADSYTVLLTNEAHIVACDSSGNPLSGELGINSNAKSNIIVYKGSTKLSYTSGIPGTNQFSITKSSETNCSASLSNDVLIINSISSDSASVVVSINVENKQTVLKNMTLTKSKQGIKGQDGEDGTSFTLMGSVDTEKDLPVAKEIGEAWLVKDKNDGKGEVFVWNGVKWASVGSLQGAQGAKGEDAKSVEISGEQVFTYTNDFNSASTPTSILLTANRKNISSNSFEWYWRTPATAYAKLSTTTETLTVSNTANWGTNKQMTFKCVIDGVYDEFTIYKVSSGSNGNDGAKGDSGADAYTVVLTNESHTIACDSSGNPLNGELGSSSKAISDILVFRGDTPLTATSSTSPSTGYFYYSIQSNADYSATKLSTTSKTFYVTAVNKDSALITLNINLEGKSNIVKTMTITKAKQGATGNTGSAGLGVKSIVEEYYLSTSNTSQVGGSWQTSPPTWVNGRYFWTRSKITYTDNSEVTTNPVCVSGAQGATGSNGTNGISITKVDVFYYLSTSSTTQSGGSWSTTAPTWVDGRYFWEKTITYFSNNTSTESNPVCITGAKGETGSAGVNGKGISSIVEQYYLSTSNTTQSGGSWQTSPPAWVNGRYYWTRSITTYTDNTTSTTNPVCVTGAQGATGSNGTNGTNGVGITSVKEYYRLHTSNTGITSASSGWSETPPTLTATNRYLWNYEEILYSNSTSFIGTARVIGVYGDTGNTGATGTAGQAGKGISKIDNYYRTHTGNTGITVSSGGWSLTPPSLSVLNKYLWNYEKITYTDSSTFDTTPCVIGVYGDTGSTGATGSQGVSVTGIKEYYLKSILSSGVTISSGTWSESAPTLDATNRYLWNYEIITYSNGSTTTIQPRMIGVWGNTGATGTAGATGATGNGISKIENFYLTTASSSGITVASAGWSLTPTNTTIVNKYIWNYEKVTYTNGSTSDTTPCIIGVHGETGATGANGTNGTDGADAYTILLTNESHSVMCDNSGNPISGELGSSGKAISDILVFRGTTQLTPTSSTSPTGNNFYYSIAPPTGCTMSKLSTTSNTFFVNTLTVDSVLVPITITVAGGRTFTKSMTINKSKQGAQGNTGGTGATGATGATVRLSPSSQYFTSADGGASYSPSSIVLTPYLNNCTFSKYQYSVNNGSTWSDVVSGQNGITLNGNVLTLSSSSALFSNTVRTVTFKIVTNVTNLVDAVTIGKLLVFDSDSYQTITKHETELKRLDTEISLRATKTEVITSLGNISVGGSNLARGTRDFTIDNTNGIKGFRDWTGGRTTYSTDTDGFKVANIRGSGSSSDIWAPLVTNDYDVKEGDNITVSFDFKSDNLASIDNKFIVAINFYDANSNRVEWFDHYYLDIVKENNKWYRLSYTAKCTKPNVVKGTVQVHLARNGSLYFKKINVGKGTLDKEWTPNDTDVQAGIDTVANANSALATRVSTAESKITADAIINSVNTALNDGKSIGSATVLDKNGFTVKGATFKVQNSAGTVTGLSSTSTGDLVLGRTLTVGGSTGASGVVEVKDSNNILQGKIDSAGFVTYRESTGIKALGMEYSRFNIYDYEKNGTRLGNISATYLRSDPSNKGITINNEPTSWTGINYYSNTEANTVYNYILFDKYGVRDSENKNYPIRIGENMAFRSNHLGFGDGYGIKNLTSTETIFFSRADGTNNFTTLASPTTGGTINIRPNGNSSSTGGITLTTSGQTMNGTTNISTLNVTNSLNATTCYAYFNDGYGLRSTATGTSFLLVNGTDNTATLGSPSTGGTINIRPNGISSSTGGITLTTSGQTMNGTTTMSTATATSMTVNGVSISGGYASFGDGFGIKNTPSGNNILLSRNDSNYTALCGANGSSSIYLIPNGSGTTTGRINIASTYMRPHETNAVALGGTSYRWSTVYAQNALSTSDSRYKENIVNINNTVARLNGDISSQDCYDYVKSSDIYTFNFKTGDKNTKLGVIANEIPDKVFSKIGVEDSNGRMIDTSAHIAMLQSALKTAIDRIEELEKKLK